MNNESLDVFVVGRDRMRWRYVAAAIVLLALLASLTVAAWFVFSAENDDFFGQNADDDLDTEPTVDNRPVVPGVPAARSRVALSRLYHRINSTADGWQSEALSEAAGDQLKKLGKLLVSDGKIDAKRCAPLVTDEFVCGVLRPGDLAEVYSDGSTVVYRPGAEFSERPAGAAVGPAALSQAVAHLAAPLVELGGVRVKFKVFRVELAAGEATTTAYFQAAARSKNASRQISATWRCRWNLSTDGGPPRLIALRVTQYEEVRRKSPNGLLLADCTHAVLGDSDTYRDELRHGINYWRGHIPVGFGIGAGGWQGMAVGDVNGDGLDDVYVCQPGGLPNAMFLHRADGTAGDLAHAAKVDWLESTRAALLVDFDNDGDQDLVLAVSFGIAILENLGRGDFRYDVRNAKMTRSEPGSLAAADYDNDGDVDLFVRGYNSRENSTTDTTLGFPVPFHDANNGGANILFRNDGQLRMTDVTARVGLDENNRRYALAASWEDFDNDGDQDLYVANDFGRNNLYRNDGGKFVDVAAELGVEDISAGCRSPGVTITTTAGWTST